MSTEQKTFKATLVRGGTHIVWNKFFHAGEPVVVSAEEKEYLEENAVDVIGHGDDEAKFPKFKFEPVTEPAAAEAAPPRSRAKAS